MNREIKFRVFEPLNKNMHYLDFALYKHDEFNQQNNFVLPTDRQCTAKDYTIMNLDAVNIMQYTSLKDKNDKEIYEGDILQDEENMLWEVIFGDGAFGVENIHIPGRRFINTDLEIIGNIYENPELLKE